MIRLSGSVFEGGRDVAGLQIWVVFEDLFTARPGREQIEHGLRSLIGNEMRIRLNYVDAIEPGENGKVQFVISKPGRAAVRCQPGC